MYDAVIIISLALFGAVNFLFGYRAFKVLLPVWGIAVGGLLSAAAVQEFATHHPLAITAAGAIGALLGVVLFSRLYFVGVFMVGGTFTGMVARTALSSEYEIVSIVFTIAVGAGGGIAALLAQKIIIIIATAASGAAALVTCLFAVLGYEPITEFFIDSDVLGGLFIPAVAATFVLALTGIVIQLFHTGAAKKTEQE